MAITLELVYRLGSELMAQQMVYATNAVYIGGDIG
jgi:hypothetical protein